MITFQNKQEKTTGRQLIPCSFPSEIDRMSTWNTHYYFAILQCRSHLLRLEVLCLSKHREWEEKREQTISDKIQLSLFWKRDFCKFSISQKGTTMCGDNKIILKIHHIFRLIASQNCTNSFHSIQPNTIFPTVRSIFLLSKW